MADVFISYASEDRERARSLASALEAKAWSVWWDRKIMAGQTFDDVIERELGAAKSIVVLWSSHSVSSEWVKNEAAVAAEQGKLVPALIDQVTLPLEFRRRQTVDLIGWDGDPSHGGFESLCDGLSTTITGAAPRQPIGSVPTGFRWTRRWTLATIAALVPVLMFAAYQAGLLPGPRAPSDPSISNAISGVWRHKSGVIWVIKPVEKSTFSVEQMDPEKGLTMNGSGVLKGNELEFTYVLGPERARGNARFKVSADGQELSGEYRNEGSAETRALVFHR